MALSNEHWRWFDEQIAEWRETAGDETHGNAADLSYHDGKRDGYREAAADLEDLIAAIKSWYF